MKIKKTLLMLLSLGFINQAFAIADIADSARCHEQTIDMTGSGDGCSGNFCERRALICVPRAWDPSIPLAQQPADKVAPIVLAFHGKGHEVANPNNPAVYARIKDAPDAGMFGFRSNLHGAMPTAIVVYFQGLPITYQWQPSTNTSDDRGWQVNVGTTNSENRDLVFVYQFYTEYLESRLDSGKLYAVGHSNGSRFAGVLWNRSSVGPQHTDLKGIAFNAAQAGPTVDNGIVGQDLFKGADPITIFMGMGVHDDVVDYELQQESVPLAANNLGVSISNPQQSTTVTNANGLKLQTYIHTETYNGSGHLWPANQEVMIRDLFGLPAQ